MSAVFLSVAALGCVSVKHPLSEVGEIITDNAIVGVWQLQDPVFGPSEDKVQITYLGDGLYCWSDGRDAFEFRIVGAAGAKFLELEFQGLEIVQCVRNDASEETAVSPTLFPIRWERRGEWMRLEYACGLDAFVGEGKQLSGQFDLGFLNSSGTLTSTAAELKAFLTKHGDKVFCQQAIYRKIVSEPKDIAP